MHPLFPTLASEQPVLVAGGELVRASALGAAAAAVAHQLQLTWPKPVAEVTFAFGRSTYAFAAALLACWRLGAVAKLPADARRELVAPTLEQLDRPFVQDTGVGRGVDVAALLRDLAAGASQSVAVSVPTAEAVRTIAYQGCETVATQSRCSVEGLQPLAVDHWSGPALAAEVAHWRGVLELGAGDRVMSTVAPTSTPGLLLGLLVPLASGAAFCAEVPEGPDAIAAAARRDGATVLVTCPAHLRQLVQAHRASGRSFPAPSVTRVISTWSPLEPGLAAVARDVLAVEVIECLGPATEGPAERVTAAPDPALLAGLAAALESDLASDAALARAGDKVVVALASSAPSAVPTLPVVAALVDAGVPEAAVRVVAVSAIPRDPNGAARAQVVRHLCAVDDRGDPFQLEFSLEPAPAATAGCSGDRVTDAGPQTISFAVQVPDNCAWYAGHFPGYPVLAGAVQLQELVLPALRRLDRFPRGMSPGVQWSALKFQARIRPGDAITIELRPAAEVVDFTVRRGDTVCSSGRVRVEP